MEEEAKLFSVAKAEPYAASSLLSGVARRYMASRASPTIRSQRLKEEELLV